MISISEMMGGVLLKRYLIRIFILLAVISAVLSFVLARREQKALSEKLIRFHVIANSDSEFDRNVKLRVRDAILGTVTDATWMGSGGAGYMVRSGTNGDFGTRCVFSNGESYIFSNEE